jgi:hypothetical protein
MMAMGSALEWKAAWNFFSEIRLSSSARFWPVMSMPMPKMKSMPPSALWTGL